MRSLPTARLHTFPRTLGGTPCHHSSRTRRDVHLRARRRRVSASCGAGGRRTCCDSRAAPVGQNVLVPGLDGGADALLPLAALLQLLPPLLRLLQLCGQASRGETGRGDASPPLRVPPLPLFLAWTTISSYCCRCFCASSAGLAGRFLENTEADQDRPTGSGSGGMTQSRSSHVTPAAPPPGSQLQYPGPASRGRQRTENRGDLGAGCSPPAAG